MTVLFWDVKNEMGETHLNNVSSVDFSEILYADHTLLIQNRLENLTALLHIIGKLSSYYYMKLNKDKYEILLMGKGSIAPKPDKSFTNGGNVKYVDEAIPWSQFEHKNGYGKRN